jgi:ribosomal-protein-alanine N-acetyltransferase
LKTALIEPAPAYLCTRIISPEAELLRIAVAPAARRQGLGRRLLERLVADLGRQAITTLHLEVAENNQPALHLYRQFGFTPAGRRPGYYDQGRTAALLLTKPC